MLRCLSLFGGNKMFGEFMFIEYIILALLFVVAIFIVFSVTVQKTQDEGLSQTIAGGSGTYYSKDKSTRNGKLLQTATLVACIAFAVLVFLVYVLQPDYNQGQENLSTWQELSEYYSIFQ